MTILEQASGKVILNIIDLETGKSIQRLTKNISDIVNNDYTEFKTDLQLTKKKEYSIQLTTSGSRIRQGTSYFPVDNKGNWFPWQVKD